MEHLNLLDVGDHIERDTLQYLAQNKPSLRRILKTRQDNIIST